MYIITVSVNSHIFQSSFPFCSRLVFGKREISWKVSIRSVITLKLFFFTRPMQINSHKFIYFICIVFNVHCDSELYNKSRAGFIGGVEVVPKVLFKFQTVPNGITKLALEVDEKHFLPEVSYLPYFI